MKAEKVHPSLGVNKFFIHRIHDLLQRHSVVSRKLDFTVIQNVFFFWCDVDLF
jgi:hypothetical protein